MPKYIDERFEHLFALPGDGGGHSVAIVAQRMGWLDYWFNNWVKERVLPLFSLQAATSEAAWHGLAYDRNGLSHDTLELLNASFLGLLRGEADWALDEHEYRQHIHRLIALSQPDLKRGAIVQYNDANTVLKAIDDLGRSEAVRALSNIMQRKQNWETFVKPFLRRAWPRQLRYRGEKSSRAFASLLMETGVHFPDAVRIILPLVRSVSNLEMFAYHMINEKDDKIDLASEFPEATLQMLGSLIDENRPTVPYQLPQVLDKIAEVQPSLKRDLVWRRLRDLTL